MAKPFSIQSPEDIAKEYAGNKQKIAQAMQMGVVDPTAGVLAGMFIDRMRAGQMQEGMPQATVAQQVMGGAPPVPAPPPVPAAGGLGATPQAAPPMAPPMGMPPEMGMAPPIPEGAPMGMAEGGLAMLPVPDAMFDEPTNGGFDDGYAGGGIVAFGPGGEVSNTLSWMDAPVTSSYGVSRSTGAHQGIDYGVKDRTPIGSIAPGVVKRAGFDKINGNYVVVEHPNGKSTSYSHLAELGVKEGQPLEAGQLVGLSGNTGRVRGKNGGYHLHLGARDEKGNRIDPGSVLEDLENLATRSMPERDLSTAEGQSQSFGDIFRMFQSQYGPTKEEKATDARVLARAEERASKEFYEKERKASMYETLAEIGFNMASSKSPFLLQAVGEAAAAAMPGAKVARKEREKLKDDALDAMQAVNGLRRKENRELLGLTFDAYKTRLSQNQFESELGFKREELKSRETQADLDRNLRMKLVEAQLKPTDMQRALEILNTGTEAEKENLKAYLALKKAADANPLGLPDPAGGGGAGAPTVLDDM
jgi:murein DD-endopeptidase MepM/ murein hydrolase activator NlpD